MCAPLEECGSIRLSHLMLRPEIRHRGVDPCLQKLHFGHHLVGKKTHAKCIKKISFLHLCIHNTYCLIHTQINCRAGCNAQVRNCVSTLDDGTTCTAVRCTHPNGEDSLLRYNPAIKQRYADSLCLRAWFGHCAARGG